MQKTLPGLETRIVASRKLKAVVAGTFVAAGDDFITAPVPALKLDFEGVAGDFHAGYTRRSGGREPWYPRGTEIRNERQLSLVAPDELEAIAERMEISQVRPEWIGANLLIEGISDFSMLPAGTMLFFEGGVTLKIDAQNGPCQIAGRAVAKAAGMADVNAGGLLFPKVARRLRGLLAWVEKPGMVRNGEALTARIPEQWIYGG